MKYTSQKGKKKKKTIWNIYYIPMAIWYYGETCT